MKEKKVRQLAAIMFTDIVGYTALMHGDEAVATSVRARHREVFRQQHEIHHGEIVQYYGDGTLSVFKSAIEAALCAIVIQRLLQEGDPVPLRIGLHMGDIVFNNTEVYGDGVNLASRIQSIGVAGSILLSGKLNDELKNHHDITTVSIGHFELKNITHPVEIFAITNQGIIIPQSSELNGKRNIQNKTIAVLPFVNMSTSAENEYFSDGITEEIINALAKIRSLKVTSRTSSFYFKNKNIPIKEIGKELNVSAILEGSVRLSGDTIRITAQLIQAEEDFHFWSETWDRKLENIFEIQDEISLLIAEKLREQFGHFEIQEHLVGKQTDNIDAYEYSLKAKYHFNKWNPNDIRLAISLYEKALELDPGHTESYLGLAQCFGFMATTGFIPAEEGWGKTIQLTHQALLLNDQLAGVHYQLGHLAFFTACDYKESFKGMQRAIEIQPNYVEAQQFMSFLYIIAGEKEKSLQHLDIALSIDPLSQETLFFNAYFHYMLEDYATSLEQLDRCLKQNPKNIPVHTVKCYCLLKMGRYDEVLHYYDDMPSDIVVPENKSGVTALAYALKKDSVNTTKSLVQLLEQSKGPDGFNAESYLFLLYSAMGDNDHAFECVRQGIEKKSSLLLLRYPDPLVDRLKDDPRYPAFHKLLYQPDEIIEKPKKKKELLDEDAVKMYSTRLMNHVREALPFLDPDLSLRSLAAQIDMHPNQLSWLLNESLGKNFNEFINQYRIEAFKQISLDPAKSHLTLTGLAYESGFNSKTVFNTYFKKETGMTPKEFMKKGSSE
ncbi:MAG: helix-turn-helix domain-containing protein [Saprospiraceae bacterium]